MFSGLDFVVFLRFSGLDFMRFSRFSGLDFIKKLRLILKSVVLNQLFDVGIGDAFLFRFVVNGQ